MHTHCHVCGAAAGTARRHGRLRRHHAVVPDADVPDRARVCPDCRAEVVELVRHWEPREPMATTCSFCGDAAETGLVELIGAVGDRVTGRRTYLLCPPCERVFGTFLSNLGPEPSAAATSEAGTAEATEPT